jgi:hypothetical protein
MNPAYCGLSVLPRRPRRLCGFVPKSFGQMTMYPTFANRARTRLNNLFIHINDHNLAERLGEMPVLTALEEGTLCDIESPGYKTARMHKSRRAL